MNTGHDAIARQCIGHHRTRAACSTGLIFQPGQRQRGDIIAVFAASDGGGLYQLRYSNFQRPGRQTVSKFMLRDTGPQPIRAQQDLVTRFKAHGRGLFHAGQGGRADAVVELIAIRVEQSLGRRQPAQRDEALDMRVINRAREDATATQPVQARITAMGPVRFALLDDTHNDRGAGRVG